MKIGIVTTWFERGAAYVSKQLLDVLSLDFDVKVFARGGESYAKGDPNWDFPYVCWARRQKSPMPTDINKREFVRWLKKEKIEVLIFNEQHYWAPILWAKELGVKTVAYVDFYKENSVDAFAIYDQIWCNTKRHFSVFSKFPQARYIPWGTNIDLYKPLVTDKREFVTFFHSAGMSPYRKGSDILIKAIAKLAKKRRDFQVVLHTQVDLKKEFPELGVVIDDLISTNILDVVNKTVHAPGLYHKGDVYVYPSRLDGIGLTVAEAMSCGLPCIVTNEAPMTEFINEDCAIVDVEYRNSRSDGYYWPLSHCSVDSLADNIEKYVLTEDLRDKANSVREFAKKELDWSNNAKVLAVLIGEIESLPLEDKAIRISNVIDQKSLPFFEIFRHPYYFLYDVYKAVKK